MGDPLGEAYCIRENLQEQVISYLVPEGICQHQGFRVSFITITKPAKRCRFLRDN
jgi:hypothetical protein